MKYERIDAFEMNFEECAAHKKYKLSTTGVGEKRIYVGHDEQILDDFFDLTNIESFIMLKKDLQQYLIDAKDEFLNPVQDYQNNISEYYNQNVVNTDGIESEKIILHFTKKYDSQNRYYLNFKLDGYSSKNWDYLRLIALPRVTKLNFVKVRNVHDKKLYIYIKPTFYIEEKEIETKFIVENMVLGNNDKVTNYRKGQIQYRRNLLDKMPACIITKVTEDRILEACHIKPYKECNEEEQYDIDNGLILTPTYHKLFDMGFISFKDNGVILISPFLSNMNRNRLSIADNNQYRIPKECCKYLSYHRKYVFNNIPDIEL